VHRVAQGVAAAHQCEVTVDFTSGEPALANDAQLAAATAAEFGALGLHIASPMRSCGSDDFAYYGAVAPSLMMFAGTEKHSGSRLHAPDFVPADSAISTIARAMLAGYLATTTAAGEL
jgi:metal-dependent amidase/aminoacylase/carboxypeptidase family protein